MRKSTVKKSTTMVRDTHTLQSRLSMNSIDRTVVSDLVEAEDGTQIAAWHRCMLDNYDSGSIEEDGQPIGFVFKLEEVSGITYQRKEPGSRLYCTLTAGLYHRELQQYFVRTYQSAAMLLQEAKNRKDEFQLTEHLALFFFSYESMHDSLELRLELKVVEVGKGHAILTSGFVGGWAVNPFGKVRGQAREQLRASLFMDVAPTAHTVALYTISNNESIKPLFRLIPAHCVCGSEDSLPGLMGNKLPHASNYFRIEYTATYILKMQLASLQLPDSVSMEVSRCVQRYFEARTKYAVREIRIKKIQLKLSFHNGWRTVSSAVLELAQKKQMEVRSKSVMYKGTLFEGKQIAVLPMVFLEHATVLSIELLYDLEAAHEAGVESASYAAACYELCLLEVRDNIKHYKCQFSTGPYQSVSNHLPALATSSPIRAEFDVHLSPADQSLQPGMHESIDMPELDRMSIEKSRVIQEKKKIKWERRKLQMEYADVPRMLDIGEAIQQTYLEKFNQVQRERDANLEKLQELKQKLEQYNITERDQETSEEEEQEEERMGAQGVYYKTLMQPSEVSKTPNQMPYVLTLPSELPSAAIVRTELMECNYASWFIFSFLSLTTESHRLPRKISVVVRFFTEEPLQTRWMEPSLTTGQLSHSEYDDQTPNDKHPVYTIRVEPNPYRPKEHYLNLLAYIESNKLQLTILDDAEMEFGYVLLPLHGLLRRRRQEVKQTIQAEVFFRDTIKGLFKVEVTNMRQQPTRSILHQEKINSKAVSPKKDKVDVITSVLGKSGNDSVIAPLSAVQRVEVMGEQRLKQRIQRFKNSTNKNTAASAAPAVVQQQHRESDRNQLINRIVQERVVVEKVICPVFMIPEVFFLQFSNPESKLCEFSLAILDPDEDLQDEHRELQLICDSSEALAWLEEKYLQGYQQSTLRNIEAIPTFTLEKNEKITLVFKYVSKREYSHRLFNDRASQLRYNRQRSISVSISAGESIAALYRISIKPQPDVRNLQLCYYAGAGESSTLVLPPFLPFDQHLNMHVDFSLSVVSQWVQRNQLAVTLQVPTLSDLLTEVHFNAIVFDDESASRVLSIWKVSVISCEKIVANGKLGSESEMLVRYSKQVLPGNQPLVVRSEDDKVVRPLAMTKTADGGVSFRLKILPNFIGSRSFHLRVQNGTTKESQRELLVEVNSEQPSYKSTFKVEHKRSVPRRQQEFEYVNPLHKKAIFTVVSTDPYLLRPEQPQFEIAAGKTKQFRLIIFSPSSKIDSSEVILSFTDRDEQSRQFFLFKLSYS